MKILILSCNTGGGHNSAGRAVASEMNRRGIETRMVDALSFASEEFSKVICETYSKMTVRAPWAFSMLYRTGGLISSPKYKSIVYRFNSLYKEKVLDYIYGNDFDVVVLPHVFPAQTVTALRIKKKLNVKTVGIATDYTCSPFWEECDLDSLIIPHADLLDEFAGKGVNRSIMRPFGIPVDDSFSKRSDAAEAKRKLGLPVDKKMVLVMSGSMGYGNLDILSEKLLKQYEGKVSFVMLGGNNEKLKTILRNRYSNRRDYHVLDFTDRVSLYMDACDIVLSKPGGLSSTEAATKRLPLILTKPIPGCETCNAEFFSRRGLAFCANSADKQVEYVKCLLEDDKKASDMVDAQRKYINSFAASDICDHIQKTVLTQKAI